MLATLRAEGLVLSQAQVRYAINNDKIARPPMDGSLSFDFGPQHIRELLTYFRSRKARSRPCVMVA
jgi:hypothetical protein